MHLALDVRPHLGVELRAPVGEVHAPAEGGREDEVGDRRLHHAVAWSRFAHRTAAAHATGIISQLSSHNGWEHLQTAGTGRSSYVSFVFGNLDARHVVICLFPDVDEKRFSFS